MSNIADEYRIKDDWIAEYNRRLKSEKKQGSKYIHLSQLPEVNQVKKRRGGRTTRTK